jgi:hypothetical protein
MVFYKFIPLKKVLLENGRQEIQMKDTGVFMKNHNTVLFPLEEEKKDKHS